MNPTFFAFLGVSLTRGPGSPSPLARSTLLFFLDVTFPFFVFLVFTFSSNSFFPFLLEFSSCLFTLACTTWANWSSTLGDFVFEFVCLDFVDCLDLFDGFAMGGLVDLAFFDFVVGSSVCSGYLEGRRAWEDWQALETEMRSGVMDFHIPTDSNTFHHGYHDRDQPLHFSMF